jgi:hypothetical protein
LGGNIEIWLNFDINSFKFLDNSCRVRRALCLKPDSVDYMRENCARTCGFCVVGEDENGGGIGRGGGMVKGGGGKAGGEGESGKAVISGKPVVVEERKLYYNKLQDFHVL